MTALVKRIASVLAGLLRMSPAPAWTPVAKGLPDDGLLVQIALNDDDVWVGYRDGDTWRYVDAMPISRERVTHWTPMASPPGAPGPISRASAPTVATT